MANNIHLDLIPKEPVEVTGMEGIGLDYAVWIGLTLADSSGLSSVNSSKYWTDQANRYLQPGDFGYVSGELPWVKESNAGPPVRIHWWQINSHTQIQSPTPCRA